MNKQWQKYHNNMTWAENESRVRWLFNVARIPVYEITFFPNQFAIAQWLDEAVFRFVRSK